MKIYFIGLIAIFLIILVLVILLGHITLNRKQRILRAIETVAVVTLNPFVAVVQSPWKYLIAIITFLIMADLLIFFAKANRDGRRFNRYVRQNKRDMDKINHLIAQNKIPMQAFDIMYLHKTHRFYLSNTDSRWLTKYINHYSKQQQKLIYAVARVTFSCMDVGVINKEADDFDFKKFQRKLIKFRNRLGSEE